MARTIAFDEPIRRGETVTITHTQYTEDTATVESTTPENITGWTMVFTVSRAKDSTNKLVGPKAMTLVTPASGIASVSLTAAETGNLEPGTYYCDVWRTDSGYERCVSEGAFPVKGNARSPA